MNMLTVKLDRVAIVSIVKGTPPNTTIIEEMTTKSFGYYMSQYDKWTWNDSKLANLNEDELLAVYSTCRKSWD